MRVVLTDNCKDTICKKTVLGQIKGRLPNSQTYCFKFSCSCGEEWEVLLDIKSTKPRNRGEEDFH